MPQFPSFPLYIVSKNRHQYERRLTSRSLDAMGVPYFVVVEQQQADAYRDALNGTLGTVLVLDKRYQDEYDTFDELGDTKSKGPGAARNFAWAHSIASGHAWHWVMDDNINGFYRLNRNKKTPVRDAVIFKCMEDFCLRYTNVAMAGPNYACFAKQRQKLPPFILNTRIYSCNLIRNDSRFRWRGRYNEDTDLSLRMLKDNMCTVQFNAFLQNKVGTQTVKGGNTEEFYAREGTAPKSEMQVAMHPDVSRIVWKFGRIHHHVDYTPFKRIALIRREDYDVADQVNEYGMGLVALRADEKVIQKI